MTITFKVKDLIVDPDWNSMTAAINLLNDSSRVGARGAMLLAKVIRAMNFIDTKNELPIDDLKDPAKVNILMNCGHYLAKYEKKAKLLDEKSRTAFRFDTIADFEFIYGPNLQYYFSGAGKKRLDGIKTQEEYKTIREQVVLEYEDAETGETMGTILDLCHSPCSELGPESILLACTYYGQPEHERDIQNVLVRDVANLYRSKLNCLRNIHFPNYQGEDDGIMALAFILQSLDGIITAGSIFAKSFELLRTWTTSKRDLNEVSNEAQYLLDLSSLIDIGTNEKPYIECLIQALKIDNLQNACLITAAELNRKGNECTLQYAYAEIIKLVQRKEI